MAILSFQIFGYSVITVSYSFKLQLEMLKASHNFENMMTNCFHYVATCYLYNCYNVLIFVTTFFTNIFGSPKLHSWSSLMTSDHLNPLLFCLLCCLAGRGSTKRPILEMEQKYLTKTNFQLNPKMSRTKNDKNIL